MFKKTAKKAIANKTTSDLDALISKHQDTSKLKHLYEKEDGKVATLFRTWYVNEAIPTGDDDPELTKTLNLKKSPLQIGRWLADNRVMAWVACAVVWDDPVGSTEQAGQAVTYSSKFRNHLSMVTEWIKEARLAVSGGAVAYASEELRERFVSTLSKIKEKKRAHTEKLKKAKEAYAARLVELEQELRDEVRELDAELYPATELEVTPLAVDREPRMGVLLQLRNARKIDEGEFLGLTKVLKSEMLAKARTRAWQQIDMALLSDTSDGQQGGRKGKRRVRHRSSPAKAPKTPRDHEGLKIEIPPPAERPRG